MSTPENVPDAIRRLREGKETLRAERRAMTLPQKVRQVVQLQEIELKAIRRRREPNAREQVWQLSDDTPGRK